MSVVEIFSELRSIDKDTKPDEADQQWREASIYFNEQSRAITESVNANLGVGLRRGERPLEVNLLRSIIERLAVVYQNPATRWLARADERLKDDDQEQKIANKIFERARADLAWARLDKLRTLHRQVIVLMLPQTARRSVVYRAFEPHQVLRWPDAAAGDMMSEDRAFALQLSGEDNPEAPQTWELWVREAKLWRMFRVNQGGSLTSDQPFAEFDFVSPYKTLPVMQIYDEIAMGQAWLPPRSTRIAWAQALNAIVNDLWRLVVDQAHSQTVVSTDSPESVPRTTGPGTAWTLPEGSVASVLTNNPKIAEVGNLFQELQGVWAQLEELPKNTFDKQRQILTGAALRVSEKSLNQRRKAQVPLAVEDERLAFEGFRSVHNVHAAEWGRPLLPADVDLEVEVGEIHQPVDAAELQNASFRDVEAGAGSIIDYIQARDSVPRHIAIKTWDQAQEDNKKFPSGAQTNLSAPKPPEDGMLDPGEGVDRPDFTQSLESIPRVG